MNKICRVLLCFTYYEKLKSEKVADSYETPQLFCDKRIKNGIICIQGDQTNLRLE